MKVKIGQVGVDAGMLMVGDPCYFVGKDSAINTRCGGWSEAIDDVFLPKGKCPGRDEGMDVYGLGVAISTTHGDGVFDVYLETSKSGRRRLIVNLD